MREDLIEVPTVEVIELRKDVTFAWTTFICFFMVFLWFPMVVSCLFMVFHGFFIVFFKELDFKELEIHRYSLMDTTNEYQWIATNEYQWISIHKFIDGPSMNMVFFLWAFLWALLWAPLGRLWAPWGPGREWGCVLWLCALVGARMYQALGACQINA